jgi:hypothetical protein
MRWAEGGGHNCQPWSRIGKNKGWLHPATLTCFTWFYSCRYFEPDSVYTENASSFDEAIVIEIMAAERIDAPRSLYCITEVEPDESSAPYDHKSTKFGPPNIGLWTNRLRLYGEFQKSDRIQSLCNGLEFEDFFYAPVCRTGDALLVATPEVIKYELQERLLTARLERPSLVGVDMGGGSLTDMEAFEVQALCPGDYSRLEGWDIQAYKKGLYQRDRQTGHRVWNQPMMIANVSQEIKYWGSLSATVFPAVLPTGMYYDLVRRRAVTVCELWLAHGWPHPDVYAVRDFWDYFPCPELVSMSSASSPKLTLGAQKDLIGQGMHLGQMSLWFCQSAVNTKLKLSV